MMGEVLNKIGFESRKKAGEKYERVMGLEREAVS